MSSPPAVEIREALQSLPSLSATSSGNAPELDEIFFPENHAEAIDPEVPLVIGNRGMGKSFWALALACKDTRVEIARRYKGLRNWNFEKLTVDLGFADAEANRGEVSRAELESFKSKISAEQVWRGVVLRRLAESTSIRIPKKLRDVVAWIAQDPAESREAFKVADAELAAKGERVLVLFDQLDQLAEGWTKIQSLTQGLLKTALAMRSYRSVRLKLFMRPDQAENRELFRFPDASKILGASRRLSWRIPDLYGLVFFELMRSQSGAQALLKICRRVGIRNVDLHKRLRIPEGLVGDLDAQGRVFDEMAGEMMGRGTKRGRPFTWIPTHLADARGEISPRTFLQVMKTSAEWGDPPPTKSAIDFNGIQEGVRRASANRLRELEEDYPWVSAALAPLRGLHVPCAPAEIESRWDEADTAREIHEKYSGSSAPIDLVMASLIGGAEVAALMKVLKEIGVFEERENGKINVPDIFRVHAGILRKGGVTPQQRRRIQRA